MQKQEEEERYKRLQMQYFIVYNLLDHLQWFPSPQYVLRRNDLFSLKNATNAKICCFCCRRKYIIIYNKKMLK